MLLQVQIKDGRYCGNCHLINLKKMLAAKINLPVCKEVSTQHYTAVLKPYTDLLLFQHITSGMINLHCV